MAGKPAIRGTRITVELVLQLLSVGWSSRTLQREYPGVTDADIRACQAYATLRSK